MKPLLPGTLFSIVLLSSASLLAQDAPATDEVEQTANLPYEIIITPQITVGDLNGLIQQVTEDFIARFNELNIDDDYDIECYDYTPTMSHIRKRICEPAFLIEARADNSKEYVDTLINGGAGFLFSSKQLVKDKDREYETLQQKFDEFTRSDKDLRGIGLVLGALKERLENFGKDY